MTWNPKYNDAKFTEAIAQEQVIIDQATAMISTLQAIQDYPAPTNAQVVGAVRKLAEHQEKIIKFIARNLR